MSTVVSQRPATRRLYETGEWNLTAYGTNLTDQHYISAINSGLRYEGAPRQYGIRVARTF